MLNLSEPTQAPLSIIMLKLYRTNVQQEKVCCFTKPLNIFHKILKAHVRINGIMLIHALFSLRHWLAIIIHVFFLILKKTKYKKLRFMVWTWIRDQTRTWMRNHDLVGRSFALKMRSGARRLLSRKGFFRVYQFLFSWFNKKIK